MIGLDTNVLVRYLVRDDEDQLARVDEFMESLTEERQGFIGLNTLVETVWVLSRAYKIPSGDLRRVLTGLLDARQLRVQEPDLVRAALRQSTESKAGIVDILIALSAAAQGCEYTVTLDQDASLIPGMRALPLID